MINIILSNDSYEFDVYTLMKALYPDETLRFEKEENGKEVGEESKEGKEDKEKSKVNDFEDPAKEPTDRLEIDFSDDSITINLTTKDDVKIVRTTEFKNNQVSKSQYKNAMKRLLYETISEITGVMLPWGILTGIRPTKIVYDLLEQGYSEDEVRDEMHKEFLCTNEKTNLSIQIARRERELLQEMDYENGYSIYIGIPFCPSTCLYCSFTSFSVDKFSDSVDQYIDALEKEIIYGATCLPNKRLTTIYFGGGTPTTLTASQLDRVLGLVKKHFDFTYVKEFCVEAGRPDSITREKLEVLKKWGVDRISINPQSMQQKTLDLIGRKHSVDQIKEAFQLARETGHNNINMDIIIGLPGETLEDVTDTLSQIKQLNPDSLTVHTLAIKRAARLNIQKENYIGMKAVGVSNMLAETMRYARENDYLPYYLYRQKNMADNLENIGYSRYGKEGLYNILIMEERQTIVALGAGGMSKFVFHKENRIERVDNVKSVTDYISRIDEMIERKRDFIQRSPGL